MLLNLIKDKKINIKDYGYVSEIKEGIPTNLTLNYLDNKYELYFDDINKYKILDEDCKYIAYNNILYYI